MKKFEQIKDLDISRGKVSSPLLRLYPAFTNPILETNETMLNDSSNSHSCPFRQRIRRKVHKDICFFINFLYALPLETFRFEK